MLKVMLAGNSYHEPCTNKSDQRFTSLLISDPNIHTCCAGYG